MPWEATITVDDEEYPVTFDGDDAPSQAELESVANDIVASKQGTSTQGTLGAMGSSLAGGYYGGLLTKPIEGVGSLAASIPGLEEAGPAIRGVGQEMTRTTEQMFPVREDLAQTFPVKAASAVGQAGGMLLQSATTAGLGLPARAVRGVGLGSAMLQGGAGGADVADIYGVTDPLQRAILTYGSGLGEAGTEAMFGLGGKSFSSLLAGQMADYAKRGLREAAKDVIGEGVEEIVAGQAQDFLTKAIVDEDEAQPGFALNGQKLPPAFFSLENLTNRLEEGALGAVGGTVFGAARLLMENKGAREGMQLRSAARKRMAELEGVERTPEQEQELVELKAQDAQLESDLANQGFAPEAQDELIQRAATMERGFERSLQDLEARTQSALSFQDQEVLAVTEPAIEQAESNPDTQATAAAAAAAQEELLTHSASQTLAEAAEQTQTLINNALQEPSPTESVPRQERPTVELPAVGEGDAQEQAIAAESPIPEEEVADEGAIIDTAAGGAVTPDALTAEAETPVETGTLPTGGEVPQEEAPPVETQAQKLVRYHEGVLQRATTQLEETLAAQQQASQNAGEGKRGKELAASYEVKLNQIRQQIAKSKKELDKAQRQAREEARSKPEPLITDEPIDDRGGSSLAERAIPIEETELDESTLGALRAVEGDFISRSAPGTVAPVLRGVRPVAVAGGRRLGDFMAAFEGATGTKVQFIDSEGTDVPFSGYYVPRGKTKGAPVILIHARAPRAVEAVLGHEWAHHLKASRPTLYKAMRDELASNIPYQTAKQELVRLRDSYRRAKIPDEIINNLVGDVFLDPDFWRAVGETNQPLLKRMWSAFAKWFDGLLTKVKKTEFGISSTVKDYERVKSAVRKALQGAPEERVEETTETEMEPMLEDSKDFKKSYGAWMDRSGNLYMVKKEFEHDIVAARQLGKPNTPEGHKNATEELLAKGWVRIVSAKGRGVPEVMFQASGASVTSSQMKALKALAEDYQEGGAALLQEMPSGIIKQIAGPEVLSKKSTKAQAKKRASKSNKDLPDVALSEVDQAYIQAAEKGDAEEVQRISDETAREAGYDVDRPLYHYGKPDVTTFISDYRGMGNPADQGPAGTYLSPDPNRFSGFDKGGRYKLYARFKNPARLETPLTRRHIEEATKQLGKETPREEAKKPWTRQLALLEQLHLYSLERSRQRYNDGKPDPDRATRLEGQIADAEELLKLPKQPKSKVLDIEKFHFVKNYASSVAKVLPFYFKSRSEAANAQEVANVDERFASSLDTVRELVLPQLKKDLKEAREGKPPEPKPKVAPPSFIPGAPSVGGAPSVPPAPAFSFSREEQLADLEKRIADVKKLVNWKQQPLDEPLPYGLLTFMEFAYYGTSAMAAWGEVIQSNGETRWVGKEGEGLSLEEKAELKRKARDFFESQGFDAVEKVGSLNPEFINYGLPGFSDWGEVVAFRPEQLKYADPVVRDADGNIIPPSQRFQTDSADIRYSQTETQEPGITLAEAQQTVADVLGEVPSFISFSDQARTQVQDGVTYLVRGAFKDGKITLYLPHVSPENIREILIEELGHAARTDGNIRKLIQQLEDSVTEEQLQAMRELGYGEDVLREEAVMRMLVSEDMDAQQRTLWEKILTAIRDLLTKLGLAPENVTDALVRDVLREAVAFRPEAVEVDERFSLDDPASRIRELSDWFAGTVYDEQEEGMEPQRARRMDRYYAATGDAAGGYYHPRTEAIQQARTQELMGLVAGLYGGYSPQYGEALMAMIRRGTSPARGLASSPFLSMNVLKWLDAHPDLRTMMKLDPQQYAEDYKRLSLLIGSSLQTFARDVYEPLNKLQENADKVTDEAMSDQGINDPMAFSQEILTPLEEELKEIAEEFNTDISKAQLVEGAVVNMENTREPTEEEEAAIVSFSEWVMGGDVESAGAGTFDDAVLAHVTGNGFNASAFAVSLQQKFKDLPDEIAASIAERISARLAGQEVKEEEVPEPNYDARAKRIVATSVAKDAMPKEKKDADALAKLTQQRLKGIITPEQYLDGLEKLGVEAETAFALARKVDLDIRRRKLAKEAADKKKQEERYAKQAKNEIERLAEQFSDTPSFKPENASELSALRKQFVERRISRAEFTSGAVRLGVPDGMAEQMASLLEESVRREAAVKRAKEMQAKAEEPAKTIEQAVNKLAAELSDTFPAASREKTEMQKLLEGYKNRRENRSSLLSKGQALGASEESLSRFADLADENQRRIKAVESAKRAIAQEQKFQKEAEQKIDVLAKELSDTRAERTKQETSELSRLVSQYADGKITAEQLREFASKLRVNESTISQLIGLIDENNRRRKAAAKGEKEIAYDTFAKRLTERLLGVKKDAEKSTSAVKRLTDAYREGKLTKRQFIDYLMERGVRPQTALELASAAGKTMREQVMAAREKAIQKALKSLSPRKTPDPRKRSTFVNQLITALENGILDSEAVRNAFSSAYSLHGVTNARLEQLAKLLKQIELIRDGMTRDKLMADFSRLINTIAPDAGLTQFLLDAYRGSVLGGVGTILAQFSGLTRLFNPFQAAQQTLWRMSDKRILLNPVNFWRVWSTIAKDGFTSVSMARSGLQGLISGEIMGLGASPTDLAQVSPVNMRVGLMGARELGQYRSSLKGPFRWLVYPAWWSNRAYNFIRAAEAWTGTIDKRNQFRALAADHFMQKEKLGFQAAWNKASQLLSEKTNPEMFKEAREVALKELKEGLISRLQVTERANELVQDKLDEQWNNAIGNQHREMSAFLNFKQQPLTYAGDLAYTGFTKGAKALPIVDFLFLFPRFFVNNFERAYFNSFLSFVFTPFLDTKADPKYLTERQKRIIRIYGSLEAYKTYRYGAAVSGVTNQFMVGMMMALAYGLAKWMDDDDEKLPPPFWITGQPPQEDFSRQKQMSLSGWWQPNTLYFRVPGTDKFFAMNYVQANPDLAINLNMVGNIADKFMFSELLRYKTDPRTKKRVQESAFESAWESVATAGLSPMTRSTYRAYFDAIGDLQRGEIKKISKLFGRPLGETAAGVGIIPAGGPGLRDVQKLVKDFANEGVPKASKTGAQAFLSGIPYMEVIGEATGSPELTGVPMINAFGETVTPYSYFSMLSRPQESSPQVQSAAVLLNKLGLAKDGPKEVYVAGDVVEVFSEGKRYQLTFDQRAQVLEAIGQRFAASLNSNRARLERLKDQGRADEVSRMVSNLAKQARTSVLNQWRGRVPVLEGDEE